MGTLPFQAKLLSTLRSFSLESYFCRIADWKTPDRDRWETNRGASLCATIHIAMPSKPVSSTTEKFTDRILQFVTSKGYQPRTLDDVALAVGIGAEEQGDFHSACRALMRLGRIVLGASHGLLLPVIPGKITGTFRSNLRGFGFVIPDLPSAHGDLYIPKGGSGGALTGDVVLAEVRCRKGGGGRRLQEGRVVSVLARGQNRFVGELHRQDGSWLVIPDGNTIHVPIVLDDAGAKGAHQGDQVVVELWQYPTDRIEARGVIVKVLGKRGEPDVETRSIVEQFGLPGEFPESVVAAAKRVAVGKEPRRRVAGREDLRKLTILTIDPKDARDFDDAISIAEIGEGRTELGVHIADVAHYVRAGEALDQEAKRRGNSIYLPRHVIPMLPELLSNGLCSLQEGQSRLTKSVFLTYNEVGEVLTARFANSVIRSSKRLTYEQAQKALDGKPGRLSAKVMTVLRAAELLARRIRSRRLREGMLVLDMAEVELLFDDQGRVTDVGPEGTEFTHTLIEMFMVEANEAIARALTEKNVPLLRRIHEGRAALSDGTLHRFLRVLGHQLPSRPSRHDLQKLLDSVHGQSDAFAVNLAVLRAMQQAEYSPRKTGHFALASEHYCHFTSPIRRYPDLAVHRLFERWLVGARRHGKDADPSEEELVALGSHCSAQERRAEAAERELKLVFILQLLRSRVGEEFAGAVTGVANVGAFVQLDKYRVDGLLRLENLPDDWWEVDSKHGTIVGERSGRRITIGARLRVRISRVHLPTRQLEVTLAEALRRDSRKSVERTDPVRRPGAARRHRRGRLSSECQTAEASESPPIRQGRRRRK